MFRFITSMFSLLILLNSASGAEMKNFIKKTGDICISTIRITGEIKFGDSEKLLKSIDHIDKQDCGIPNISFNSEGGDLNEAINLGKIIRFKELSTYVFKTDVCFSACVLSYAGGVGKIGDGKIGVHRPYFDKLSSDETVENIKKRRDATILNMRSYLDQMDVNVALVDLMISIRPENIKVLSFDDLVYYRLYGLDTNYEEKMIAEMAYDYGTTSSIMRKRFENVMKCFSTSINSVCQEAAYWGLSESTYKDRRILFEKTYSINESCFNTYKQCQIRIMNGGKP